MGRLSKPNFQTKISNPVPLRKLEAWAGEEESISFHTDEAQLPPDGGDFDRFIIYVRDNPPTSGGCNGEFNDCLYQCLKYIYVTFFKMPKAIKTEYVKRHWTSPRDAPVPASCMDEVDDLARNLVLDIIGDVTLIFKE